MDQVAGILILAFPFLFWVMLRNSKFQRRQAEALERIAARLEQNEGEA